MENIEFMNDWSDFFNKADLKTFDDFISYSKGKLVNENKKRDVVQMTFDTNSGSKTFFMKRFYSPHYKDMFFAFRNYGKLCTQAELEFKNANYLLKNSIDTYHPVCVGGQTTAGIEKASFVITEQIQGQETTDFVAENFDAMSDTQKNQLIIALAKFVRKIHDTNISMADLYLWHIFITNESPLKNDNYDFAIIDLHRMSIRLSGANRVRNLGAFDFSLSEKYFNNEMRDLFFNTYAKGLTCNIDNLLSKVKKRSDVLKNRRRRVQY